MFASVIGSGEGMRPVHRRGARPPSRARPPSGARRKRFAFGVCIRMEFGAVSGGTDSLGRGEEPHMQASVGWAI